MGLLNRKPQNWIDLESFQQIKALDEVAQVEQEIRIPFPVATSAKIVLGLKFEFDSTVSGYSKNAVDAYLPEGQSFSGEEDIIPILLSPLLIEIYNSTIVDLAPEAERKTMADFLEREVEFTFGKINYLQLLHDFPEDITPQKRNAKIVGFAPFLSPFTMGIPESIAREMRLEYEGISNADVFPRSLLVQPQSLQMVAPLKEKLRGLGFMVKDLSENIDTVRILFEGLQGILLFSAGTTLFIASLFLFSMLSLSILEQRQTIGVLQALGASRRNIQNIFALQGVGVVIFATLLGFLLAFITASSLNQIFLSYIPTLAIAIPSIFLFDFYLLLQLFIFVCLATFGVIFLSVRRAISGPPLKSILV